MNVNSADLASQKPLESPAKVPAHQHVYERVRKLIMFGDLAPGQAVTIQGLAETLDAGMTPVREAIRRNGLPWLGAPPRHAVRVLHHLRGDFATVLRVRHIPLLLVHGRERCP